MIMKTIMWANTQSIYNLASIDVVKQGYIKVI